MGLSHHNQIQMSSIYFQVCPRFQKMHIYYKIITTHLAKLFIFQSTGIVHYVLLRTFNGIFLSSTIPKYWPRYPRATHHLSSCPYSYLDDEGTKTTSPVSKTQEAKSAKRSNFWSILYLLTMHMLKPHKILRISS